MIEAFIIEAVFISEQINQCRFGALLEISDTLSSKLNFLVIWFSSAGLINILQSFTTMLYDFEKQWLSSLPERP